MCSPSHAVSQNLAYVLHIVRGDHMVLGMINVLISSYVLQWVDQNRFDLSTQILPDNKLVHLCQISEVRVVNGAQRIHHFHDFAHCSPLFFPQSQR